MAHRTIFRVWYGKRRGIPQSFEDISTFDGAANFAAFVEADRIEVVASPPPMPAVKVINNESRPGLQESETQLSPRPAQ